tara:strand:+ start:182 stop:496 length:315 start_codon:yes stop_codon:yes gene_type:complete
VFKQISIYYIEWYSPKSVSIIKPNIPVLNAEGRAYAFIKKISSIARSVKARLSALMERINMAVLHAMRLNRKKIKIKYLSQRGFASQSKDIIQCITSFSIFWYI